MVATGNTNPTIGLDNVSPPSVLHENSADAQTIRIDPNADQHDTAVYEDYVHVPTGRRIMIPVRIDPATGQRTRFCSPPMGFVLANMHNEQSASPPTISILERLMNIFRCSVPSDTQADDLSTPAPAPVAPPTSIRQPVFDEPEEPDCALTTSQHHRYRLSTKALEALKTKLELHKIAASLVDIRAAIARVDKPAYRLLVAPDWRVLMSSDEDTYTSANARIADVLDSVLDSTAENVILLKSTLREADQSDRPGILCSGMDMIEEIGALVTDRSLGEVKLAKQTAASVAFTPGAPLATTRLVGDEVKARFAIRPEAERAVKNALLHEILEKYPTSSEQLLKQKEEYERELYRTEMAPAPGLPPPWTAATLISFIAVDMARASKEVSAVDRQKFTGPQLHSAYICGNCKAQGKHLARDCPNKCKSCTLNFCPGAWHMACAVTFDTSPSSRGEIPNAFGRPLPDSLVRKLQEAWQAKHPSDEVSCLEMMYCDDSD